MAGSPAPHITMDTHASERRRLLDEWLSEVLCDYPEQSVAFIATTSDPFRNPVGDTLRRNLAILLDAILDGSVARGGEVRRVVTTALAEIVRLRAVQSLPTNRVASFLEPLQRVLGDEQARASIERLTKLATDIHADCRAQMDDIRAREARRRTWVIERLSRDDRDHALRPEQAAEPE